MPGPVDLDVEARVGGTFHEIPLGASTGFVIARRSPNEIENSLLSLVHIVYSQAIYNRRRRPSDFATLNVREERLLLSKTIFAHCFCAFINIYAHLEILPPPSAVLNIEQVSRVWL